MQDPNETTATTISREELYKRAWATPLEMLAHELRVPTSRLVKTFRDLQIPYPRPSYWKRQGEGKFVFQQELPEPSREVPSFVRLQRPDEQKSEARRSQKWHPVIAGWHEERKNLMLVWPHVTLAWNASQLRRHQILDQIFKAVEEHGLNPQSRHKRDLIYFDYATVEICCALREKKRRVATQRTRANNTSFDLQPTGGLIFKIEGYFGANNGIRRQWEEGEGERLDDMIPDIVSALARAAPALLRLKQEEEASAKKEREERQRKRDKDALRRQEDQFWRLFVSYAARLHTLDNVRNLVARLERDTPNLSSIIADRSLSDWLQWVKIRLAEYDPLLIGAERLFKEITQITNPRDFRSDR